MLKCVAVCSITLCLAQSLITVHTFAKVSCNTLLHTATVCNTFQHTATHCNTLQHAAQGLITVHMTLGRGFFDMAHSRQHTATHCNTLQHTATHCNTLQHTATHCNTLQHASTRSTGPHYGAYDCWKGLL